MTVLGSLIGFADVDSLDAMAQAVEIDIAAANTVEPPAQFEVARDCFLDLLRWYRVNKASRNEATTRLHLVDTIFFRCLGWSRFEDCEVETPHGNEYADYVLKCPMRAVIVEAKREGTYFEIPSGKKSRRYSLRTLTREIPSLRDAIKQVSGYCQERGSSVAVVTNGHQIVAFIGSRDDGKPPSEGRALVFETMQSMADEFGTLWKMLSKPGIQDRHIHTYLLGASLPVRPPKLSEQVYPYPGLKGRNILQADLHNLAVLLIEDVPSSREFEHIFLERCYCRNNALSQHALLSKTFLENRYEAIFHHMHDSPVARPAVTKHGIETTMAAEGMFRRPVLLIGDVGVGKTTFIRRLVTLDAKELFDNAITIYIDFGAQAAFEHDLREFVLDEIERQLYQRHAIDIYEDRIVRGIYNLELKRFRKGIYSKLRKSDPLAFQEKEVHELERLMSKKADHLIKALEHLSKGQRKQVIVFLDNVDQRTDDIQQQVFLLAHNMAASWPAAVFVTLRPETFQRSQRDGSLSAYHTKVFTIAPPRVDRVLEKRLKFGLAVTSGEIPLRILQEVTRKSKENLAIFLNVLLESFATRPELIELLDNISGGNLRMALAFVEQFISSGHIDTRKIISKYSTPSGYLIPLHELIRAIMYGDGEFFDPRTSPITNVFDISTPDCREHFLLLSVLDCAQREGLHAGKHGFVPLDNLVGYAQSLAFTSHSVSWSISRACERQLLETSGRIRPIGHEAEAISLRITSAGAYHLQKLCTMFTYVDAMIIDSPIVDPRIERRIEPHAKSIRDRLDRADLFVDYLDECWAHFGSRAPQLKWPVMSECVRDNIAHVRSTLVS